LLQRRRPVFVFAGAARANASARNGKRFFSIPAKKTVAHGALKVLPFKATPEV
jgi:hypothetical protein